MAVIVLFIITISVQTEYYTNTNYIYELTGNDSIVYCATNGGVVAYNHSNGTFAVLTNTDGLLRNRQTCISVDSSGYLWVGNTFGLVLINKDFSNIQNYPVNWPNVQEIICVKDSVFVGSPGGLLIIDTRGTPQDFTDDVNVAVYESNGLPSENVLSIAVSDTSIWIGTDGGLVRFTKGFSTYTQYSTADGLLSNHINKITVIDTTIYVGTDNGLNSFQSDYFDTLLLGYEIKDISYAGDSLALALDSVSQFGFYYQGDLAIEKNGLPYRCRVLSLGDIQGNLFCGLSNRYSKDYYGEGIGTYNFSNEVWNTTKNECLPSNHITDITANESGVFVCTGARAKESRGFGWLDNSGVWTNFNTDSILSSNHVHRCVTAPDNKVWFGFNAFPENDTSVMVFSFDPQNDEWNFIRNGYNNMELTVAIWDIEFDSHNNMYLSVAGPSDKLWVIDSALTTSYWLIPSQVGFFIEIAIDSTGKIWRTMTDAGLIMTDTKNTLFDPNDDGFHNYTTADGLASNYTRGCIVDRNSNLYIATDTGLAIYNGTTFSSITGFTDEDLFDVELDSQGRVWMLARDGVYYYDPELNITDGWRFGNLSVHTEFLSVSNEIIQVQGFEFDPLRGCFWIGGETGLLKIAVQFDSLPGLDNALVYPNPVVGKSVVRIKNIPLDAQVNIYSIAGRLVAENLSPDVVFGEVVWNIPDDAGSGLYFALIRSDQGIKVCKFAIVR